MGRRKMIPTPEGESSEDKSEEIEQETTESEIETLKNELDAKIAEAEANLSGWKRAQADFINYKRRCEQEKEETIKYSNTNFILNILPLLDDFERAYLVISTDQTGSRFLDGLKMVEHKFKSFLQGQGVTEVKALGEQFDPNMHEALLQVDGEEGKVVQEFEKGYKLYDRVIRASKVGVGKGKPAKEKEDI
jgi:molecular chaperone GrpE